MAKEKTNKVEETEVKEPKQETTKVDLRKKAKDLTDNITKVNLAKPPTIENEKVEKEPVKEEEVVVVNEEPKVEEEVKEEVKEVPVIEEVTNEDPVKIEVPKVELNESQEQTYNLSEKLEKVQKFMNDTGGDLNDYVNLNRDVSKLDDSEVLDEYYRTTKSHLTPEERNFLLEDTFGIDEEVDDNKAIRKKKIALKEPVAEARAHLDRQKSK